MSSFPEHSTGGQNGAHPSRDELDDFVRGKLTESRSLCIEAHLEECPDCCERLSDFAGKSDPFESKLVQAAGSAGHAWWSEPLRPLSSPTCDPPPVDLPRHIGRFRIQRLLGHGGFGVVFLAHDPRLGRFVALKIPRAGHYLSRDLRERFLREGRAAAALDHSNIVAIHEAGETDETCYIASHYCRGPNLASWLKRQTRPITFNTAAQWVAELASAIEHAHERGVLHRDLKPANIILDGAGEIESAEPSPQTNSNILAAAGKRIRPRITDFGLAKLDDELGEPTRSNMVMGTAGYMSPEQTRGQETTSASDIYSLGAILYELLAGRPPFTADSELHTIQRVRDEDPIPPSRLRTRMPRDLETICLTCLHKEPRRRYASAAALRTDLQRFLDGQPITARPPSAFERQLRWCRRRPALVALGAITLLLLILLVAASTLSSWRLRAEQELTIAQLRRATNAESKAASARGRAERGEAAAKRELFSALISEARANRLTGRIGQKLDSLAALKQAAELSLDLTPDQRLRLRNELIACMPLIDLSVDKSWPAYPPGSSGTGIALSNDMRMYAKVDPDGHVVVRAVEDNSELARWDIDAPLSRSEHWRLLLRFSADNNYLAARGRNEFSHGRQAIPTRAWVLRSGRAAMDAQIPPAGDSVYDFDFRPTRPGVAVTQSDGSVCLFDLSSGEQRPLLPPGRAPAMVRFAPDGCRLATAHHDGIRIVDVESGNIVQEIGAASRFVAWSPDSSQIAGSAADGSARIWNVATGKMVATCAGHQSEVVAASFQPGSGLIATTSWADTRLWNAATGLQLLQVDHGNGMEFSADGGYLGFGYSGASVGRYTVAPAVGFYTLSAKVDPYQSGLEISADGKLLLSVDRGRLLFWDPASGRLLGEIAVAGFSTVLRAAFDDTGQSVWTASAVGLHRWPIRWSESSDQTPGGETRDVSAVCQQVTIGPPKLVALDPAMDIHELSLASNGRLLVAGPGEVRVLDVSKASPRLEGRVRHSGWSMSASRDGRFLATSQWQGLGTRLWDLKTGRLIRVFSGINARVSFSPDGSLLIIGNPGAYEAYDVGGWRQLRRFGSADVGVGSPLSFTRDGRLAAVSGNHDSIRLLDAHTWDELAKFVAPGHERITEIHLGPLGRRLVARTAGGALHVWDLYRVRRQLGELGLDWTSEPIPSEPGESRTTGSVTNTTVYFELGEFDEVEQITSQLSQQSLSEFDRVELLLRRGRTHARHRSWAGSIADFSEVIERDPARAEVYIERGKSFLRIGQVENALSDFKRAVIAAPDHCEPYRQCAAIHMSRGDWDKAVDALELARKINPENRNSWGMLGAAYVQTRRWTDAVAAMNRVLSEASSDWNTSAALSLRATALYRVGCYGEALADGKRSLELDPANYQRCNALAWALTTCPDAQFRDVARAIELSRRSIMLNRENSATWTIFAVALYRNGDWQEALDAAGESTRLGGESAYNALVAAMACFRQGKIEDARRWYRTAIPLIKRQAQTSADLAKTSAEADLLLRDSN